MSHEPIIVVCGATATGKTDFALKLAKEKNGELVSADSRQIYKFLNIGTGKDLPPNAIFIDQTTMFESLDPSYSIGFYEVERIPLWLYDVITPDKQFSASEHAKVAREVIQDIWSRRKLPIVVGGTGFYIQTLVDGIDTEGIPPNEELRRQLNNKTVEQLQQQLEELNPDRLSEMNNSDRNNPRRLIRAIEVSELQPQTIGENKKQPITSTVEIIGLNSSREELQRRIDTRIQKRLEQGLLTEIEDVLKRGYTWTDPGLNTLGYKEWQQHFEGTATKEETIETWKRDEHDYAKRQETWFKRDKRITWIPV